MDQPLFSWLPFLIPFHKALFLDDCPVGTETAKRLQWSSLRLLTNISCSSQPGDRTGIHHSLKWGYAMWPPPANEMSTERSCAQISMFFIASTVRALVWRKALGAGGGRLFRSLCFTVTCALHEAQGRNTSICGDLGIVCGACPNWGNYIIKCSSKTIVKRRSQWARNKKKKFHFSWVTYFAIFLSKMPSIRILWKDDAASRSPWARNSTCPTFVSPFSNHSYEEMSTEAMLNILKLEPQLNNPLESEPTGHTPVSALPEVFLSSALPSPPL